uniref:Retrotransposon protein, putative, Ty1-copia subclass n=1 Tax=Tanacetum cinerariifolium TaxID=118510 RepID=A0A699HMY4_TANCI|nr:retrotransposon protein, putative, Ty1-copia subclass [Tanacetum cinerariifolium]
MKKCDYPNPKTPKEINNFSVPRSCIFDVPEASSTTCGELLFYSDRLEIQHIEASMNSKELVLPSILYAANARLNAASSNLNVVSSSSALANSPAFVRPSRTPTSTRFGSALNIETLVSAAEHRETPIDETIKSLGPGCIFTLTAISKWECSSYGRALALHARGMSNKKAKHNLDSTYLWHCHLAHISKECIEKPQQEGLLRTIDDDLFDQCVSCLSGKMTKGPFPHRTKREIDLLGIIHTDVWGCKALVKWDMLDKLQQRSVKCIFIGYPRKTMGYYFYFPPKSKIIIARYIEFFEKSLITQEVSGRAIDLEEIQDEYLSPYEITSEIPMDVEGFEPPQEEVILIRRSKRTHRAPIAYV